MRFQYINRQEVAGFVGSSIQLRYMPSGDAVLDITVATTHSWKDRQGEWQNDTEWHNCIFYRKMAEDAALILKKGAAVHVVGRTFTREWEAKDGSKRKRKEIVVESFHPILYERTEKDSVEPPSGDAPPESPAPSSMAGFDQG